MSYSFCIVAGMSKHPLAAYREKEEITQDELADRLEVAGLTVRRWEEGIVLPQGRVRDRIHSVTGVRFSEFVTFLEQRQVAAE